MTMLFNIQYASGYICRDSVLFQKMCNSASYSITVTTRKAGQLNGREALSPKAGHTLESFKPDFEHP